MADRPETQEQSIKARKSQLFEVEEKKQVGPKVVRKPFDILIRETPATPLPTAIKALLWALTVVVLGLLVVALASRGKGKPRAGTPAKATTFLPASAGRTPLAHRQAGV